MTQAMTRSTSATTPPTSRSAASGNDSVVADAANLDVLDGFETVDRTQVVTPPPVDTSTRPVTITGGTVKVTHGKAPIKVSCPAASPSNCTGSLAVRTANSFRFLG